MESIEATGMVGTERRFAIVASRFNEIVVSPLVEGAQRFFRSHGIAEDRLTCYWVPGALEIPAVVTALVDRGEVAGIVALGAVIRGETAHFDVVVRNVSAELARVAARGTVAIANGVLTVDNLEQAFDRAGGKVGNKGFDAAETMMELAVLLERIGKG
ncbi:MAG: 6,7-dimethyl-8-ribityllumazine synthase [Ferrimicrobium sp.]